MNAEIEIQELGNSVDELVHLLLERIRDPGGEWDRALRSVMALAVQEAFNCTICAAKADDHDRLLNNLSWLHQILQEIMTLCLPHIEVAGKESNQREKMYRRLAYKKASEAIFLMEQITKEPAQ